MITKRLLTGALATTAVVPAVLLALAPAANAAACGTRGNECYAETVTPHAFVAGASTQFTFALTYEGDHDAAGAANVTAPSGYTITSVGTPSRGTATLSGNVIQLRNMATGTTNRNYSVAFTANTPSTVGSGTWSAPAVECSTTTTCSTSDLTFDSAHSNLATAGQTSTTNCPNGDVSCGTNFIRYNQASTVSTGSSANSSAWLVGTLNFPATSVTGGQFFSMDAYGTPGTCPSASGPVQCTYEMRLDTIPAPYDATHRVTLTLLCDQSHCSPTSVPTVFKKQDDGTTTAMLPCSASPTTLCYDFGPSGTSLQIIVRNISAGDPKIAGITVG